MKLQISLTIAPALLEKVDELAAELGQSRVAIINMAIYRTVAVRLANGGRFRLTLRENEQVLRLTLGANGLTISENGSPTARSAHVH